MCIRDREKDMIPHIQEYFNNRFLEGYSTDEFNSGIGIADLVFSPKLNQQKYYFRNFEILYHTLSCLIGRIKKSLKDTFTQDFQKTALNLSLKNLRSLT